MCSLFASQDLAALLAVAFVFIVTAWLAVSQRLTLQLTSLFLLFGLAAGWLISQHRHHTPTAQVSSESIQGLQDNYSQLKNDLQTHKQKLETFIQQTQQWINRDTSEKAIEQQVQEAKQKKVEEELKNSPVITPEANH